MTVNAVVHLLQEEAVQVGEVAPDAEGRDLAAVSHRNSCSGGRNLRPPSSTKEAVDMEPLERRR